MLHQREIGQHPCQEGGIGDGRIARSVPGWFVQWMIAVGQQIVGGGQVGFGQRPVAQPVVNPCDEVLDGGESRRIALRQGRRLVESDQRLVVASQLHQGLTDRLVHVQGLVPEPQCGTPLRERLGVGEQPGGLRRGGGEPLPGVGVASGAGQVAGHCSGRRAQRSDRVPAGQRLGDPAVQQSLPGQAGAGEGGVSDQVVRQVVADRVDPLHQQPPGGRVLDRVHRLGLVAAAGEPQQIGVGHRANRSRRGHQLPGGGGGGVQPGRHQLAHPGGVGQVGLTGSGGGVLPHQQRHPASAAQHLRRIEVEPVQHRGDAGQVEGSEGDHLACLADRLRQRRAAGARSPGGQQEHSGRRAAGQIAQQGRRGCVEQVGVVHGQQQPSAAGQRADRQQHRLVQPMQIAWALDAGGAVRAAGQHPQWLAGDPQLLDQARPQGEHRPHQLAGHGEGQRLLGGAPGQLHGVRSGDAAALREL